MGKVASKDKKKSGGTVPQIRTGGKADDGGAPMTPKKEATVEAETNIQSSATALNQNQTNGNTAEEAGDNNNNNNGWDEPVLFAEHKETKIAKDDFELLHVIGKGSFGKVLQVRKKDTGKIYAMKVLRKEAIVARKQVAHTRAERSILQKIQHPFIVGLHYAFQTDEKLYMVLDYVNGGELFFHLKREGKFSEERVKFYSAEITSALCHLHSFGIVYRDLKPENILLDSEGHITITDFGLSKEITDYATTFCGTPEYLAPEVLKGQGHGHAVDWWSLGTLIYEMLNGLPPFYSQNVNIMYQRILTGELRFPSFFAPDTQSLLEGLLCRDPTKRLGDDTVKSHAYFKDINWQKLDKKEYQPLFKPKVKGEGCISQIDPIFTRDTAIDSLVEKSVLEVTPETSFDNFTYVSPTAIQV